MTEARALGEAMERSTDVANQVNALSNERDAASPEEETEEETRVDFSGVAGGGSAIFQIIELEDLGDPFDEDAAPAITPNCTCSG